MTLGRICPATSAICVTCQRVCAHRDRDKARRKVDHGRSRRAWDRLRKKVLERDLHTCRDCRRPATTVHLDPRLRGRHDVATVDDCIALCRSCHGRRDQKRSGRRRGRL